MRTLRGVGRFGRHGKAFAPERRQRTYCRRTDLPLRKCGEQRRKACGRHVVRKNRREASLHENTLCERGKSLQLRTRIGGKAFLFLLQIPYLTDPLQDFVHNPLGGEGRRRTTAGKETCFKRRCRTFACELVLLEQVGNGLGVVKPRIKQDFRHKAANLGGPGIERSDFDDKDGMRPLRVARLGGVGLDLRLESAQPGVERTLKCQG